MSGIDEPLRAWMASQDLFFVATVADGEVDVTPKGPIDALAVLDTRTVAYMDTTAADGQLMVMLCAFDGPPRVVKLHGVGRTVAPGGAEHDALRSECDFSETDRPIVVVDVGRVTESDGDAVPLMDYRGLR